MSQPEIDTLSGSRDWQLTSQMSRFVAEQGKDQVLVHDDAWEKARQDVESDKYATHQENKQQDGKSLYEVLQQNKAAKQDAFEESIRLKNQIRALADDEIEFLDSIEESTRTKEAAIRKETAEQLELFRKQRQAAEQDLLENGLDNERTTESSKGSDTWSMKKKKKKKRRDKDTEKISAPKRRKLSTSPVAIAANTLAGAKEDSKKPEDNSELTVDKSEKGNRPKHDTESPELEQKILKAAASKLGLAAYSSDED